MVSTARIAAVVSIGIPVEPTMANPTIAVVILSVADAPNSTRQRR